MRFTQFLQNSVNREKNCQGISFFFPLKFMTDFFKVGSQVEHRGQRPCAKFKQNSPWNFKENWIYVCFEALLKSLSQQVCIADVCNCYHPGDVMFFTLKTISYPESSGFLVSGGDAGRDSGIMEFLSQKIWDSGFSAHALMFRNGSQIFQKGRHCRERENRQES